MSTAVFTIFNAGVEKSLADWGLDDLQFSDNDLAPSVVEFTAAGRAVDASDLFAYGSRVIIYQNRTGSGTTWTGGACWFDGRVEPWERNGTEGSEDCIGRIVNAWWYFKLTYKMQFIRTTGVGTTTTYTTNRVVLGVTINGGGTGWVFLNTGGQISAAVNYAISQGAPVTLGNVAPWAPVISDFQKNISVAQVIQKMWQIESDFSVVWDYSTVGTNPLSPGTPTIHFLKCSTANVNPALTTLQKAALVLTPVTVNLDAGNWISKFKCKPRPDWIKSYVNLDYDQITTIGSVQYLSLGNDHWPATLPTDTESKFSGVDLYFDLAGAKISVTNQQSPFTSAAFDITSLTQWQKWKSELLAPTVASAVILGSSTTPATTTLHPAPAIASKEVDSSGATVAYNTANAYELLDGSHCDWMTDSTLMGTAGYPAISAQKIKCTAWVFITYTNGSKTFKQVTKEFTAVSYNSNYAALLISVNASSIAAYAETQPTGLAQIMFNAWRSLSVEGKFNTLETEIGATNAQITRKNCLNFTSAAIAALGGDGSIADWSAVNAPVRRVSGSVVKGTTTVEFGAPLHLTANALVDLVRASRVRVVSVDLNYLFGGALSTGGGTVKHPRKTHAHAAEHGADEPQVHVVAAPDAVDTTRTNVLTNDGTLGHVIVVQQPTAGGSAYTTGVIAPEYNGAGAPSSSTLATSAYYRVGDKYADTTANGLYRCTTAGDKTASVWAQISGGGGSGAEYAFVSDGGNFWVCTNYLGKQLNIAKAFKMRTNLTSETIAGVTHTYTYALVSGLYQRTNTYSGMVEIEQIVPAPVVGDAIFAIPCSNMSLSVAPLSVLTAAVAAAGTGYAVNDVLTVAGGTFITVATLKVLTIGAGGSVATVSVVNGGAYTAAPGITGNAATGGTGTGATFNLTMSGQLREIADGRAWAEI